MSEHLNKQAFRDRVFNFEKNKEWKYEGTLPALVDFWRMVRALPHGRAGH